VVEVKRMEVEIRKKIVLYIYRKARGNSSSSSKSNDEESDSEESNSDSPKLGKNDKKSAYSKISESKSQLKNSDNQSNKKLESSNESCLQLSNCYNDVSDVDHKENAKFLKVSNYPQCDPSLKTTKDKPIQSSIISQC